MKGYVRYLISGLTVAVMSLNAHGDEASWERAFSSSVIEQKKGVALSNVLAKREIILAEAIAWTVAQTDYRWPKTLPEISFQPNASFADRGCSSSADCSVMGAYRDGEDRIFLHEDYRDLAGVVARAMLVHELTHLLQDQSGVSG